jgi:LysM repeat protein
MDQPAPDALDEAKAASPGIVACPFLVSAAGPWRSATPARDHRCSRAAIGTRLDLDHQRQFCLGSGGPGCPRFVAARAPGGLATMLPVVLDRGPLGVNLERSGLRRLAAPATVVVVGAALGAFLLARGPGAPGSASGNGVAGSTARPSTRPTAMPSSAAVTAAPSEVPVPTPAPSRSPLPSSTPAASVSPAPAGGRTYTVRPGDTLGAIAAHFGTTTRALVQLNGIADPSYIRVGQVLKLP